MREGIKLAIKLLERYEQRVNASLSPKEALRLARDSLQQALDMVENEEGDV